MPNRVKARPRDGLHYRQRKALLDSGLDPAELEPEEPVKRGFGRRKAKRVDFGRLDNNEVETPDNVLDLIRAEFGIFFDPCPFVGKGLKPEIDGLSPEQCPWQELNFVNPPYDEIDPWVIRAYAELHENKTTLVLVPARTGTAYWRDLVWGKCTELRFFTGKIIFKGYHHPSPHQLVFIIFKSESDRRAEQHNTNWPLLDVLRENPPLQEQYKDLWAIALIASPTCSGFTDRPLAWHWMQTYFTVEQLLDWTTDRGDMSIVRRVVLPFFARMLAVMRHADLLVDYQDTARRAFCLPELLRRNAYRFSQMPLFSETLVQEPLDLKTYRASALGFYNAFRENAHLHAQNSGRIVSTRVSYDGEFQQQCLHC